MHGSTLCSALFGFAFLDAVSAATGTWPDKLCEHCSEPLTMMDVEEDEAALLQAGSLNLHSKTHDHGDYAPAKDERSEYSNYHEMSKYEENREAKSRAAAYAMYKDQKDQYREDQYGKTSDYAYSKQDKDKYAYHDEKGTDRTKYGKIPNHVYAEKVEVKHEYSSASVQIGKNRDNEYAKDRHDDYHADDSYDINYYGKNYDHGDSTAKDSYDDHYRSNQYDDGDDSKHTYDDCDRKDAYPQYNSKMGDYAYTKKRSDNYHDNYGEGRSDYDNLGKSHHYYQEAKYDSDHSGMTGHSTHADGTSMKYNDARSTYNLASKNSQLVPGKKCPKPPPKTYSRLEHAWKRQNLICTWEKKFIVTRLWNLVGHFSQMQVVDTFQEDFGVDVVSFPGFRAYFGGPTDTHKPFFFNVFDTMDGADLAQREAEAFVQNGVLREQISPNLFTSGQIQFQFTNAKLCKSDIALVTGDFLSIRTWTPKRGGSAQDVLDLFKVCFAPKIQTFAGFKMYLGAKVISTHGKELAFFLNIFETEEQAMAANAAAAEFANGRGEFANASCSGLVSRIAKVSAQTGLADFAFLAARREMQKS